MNDRMLRDLLGPRDDGRGFVEAVLMRAAGALHRRRLAAEAAAAQLPAFAWLERWARPWLVAALLLLALGALAPALPWRQAPRSPAVAPGDNEAMTQSLLPADVAVAVLPQGR